jgi:hypothetical protein
VPDVRKLLISPPARISPRPAAIVIAYGHRIAHGIDLRYRIGQQKLAVDCGHWPLYRYRPVHRSTSRTTKHDPAPWPRAGPTCHSTAPVGSGCARAGGAFGFADPALGDGCACVTNRMGTRLSGDPRDVALRDALYSSLAPRSGTLGQRVAW